MSIQKIKKVILPLIALIIVLFVAIIGFIRWQSVDVFTNISFDEVLPKNVDYIYNNYDEFDSTVNLVIIGEVIKSTKNTDSAVSKIRVEKVIKGNVKSDYIINVEQVGKPSEVEYFEPNERHLLFLWGHDFSNFNTPCSLINPIQGNMEIVDGKTKRTSNYQFINDGVPEDDVVEALRAKVHDNKIYETYDMEVSASDLVIIGESTTSIHDFILFDDYAYECNVYDFKVDKVFKGDVNSGDIIKVFGQQLRLDKLHINGRNILFLKGFRDSENNIFYSPINTEQGIMAIVNGKTIKSNDYQFINHLVLEDDLKKEKVQNLDKVKASSK